MAIYRQIHIKIWTSPDFQELSPAGKLVFIYLFSTSHRNDAALYRITLKTISRETDLTVDEVDKAIAEMETIGVIKYDRENHIVWVINAVRYQTVSPNGIKAIKNDLQTVAHPFVEDFQQYYHDILTPSVTPSKGIGSPSEDAPVNKQTNKQTTTTTSENELSEEDISSVEPEFELGGSRDLLTAFEQEFGRPLSQFELEQIVAWGRDYSDELILYALRMSIMSQKRTFKYIQGILTNWQAAGVKCIQDVEELERQHQEQKTSRASPAKTNIKPQEEEREVYMPQSMKGG